MTENIANVEISIVEEAQNQEEVTEEQSKKDQEYLDNENQGQIPTQDNPEKFPSTSGGILTGGHLPMVELGLVPFTSSKHHEVEKLEYVFFHPKRKSIVWSIEKTLKIGTQPKITIVTKRMVVKDVEEDMVQMASWGVATAQVNTYNVIKLKGEVDQYKYNMA